MDKKNTKKSVVVKSKSQRGKKKLEVSTSRSRRTSDSKRVKAEDIPDSSDSSSSVETDEDYAEFLKTYNPQESCSSGSDKTDEDYAEFLKTYDPQESYPYDSDSREEEGSRVTVESQKKPPNYLKAKSSKRWVVLPGEDDGSSGCCGIQDSCRALS
jgi:hypothetical protein